MGTLPPSVFLVFILVALTTAVGLLVWVVGYIRGGGKWDSGQRDPPSVVEVSVKSEGSTPVGEQELLRVSRAGKNGLAVYVQGQRYRHLREIRDPQLGRETVEALKAVLAFAEGWLPALRPAPPQPASRKSTVDEEVFLERLSRSNVFSSHGFSRSLSMEPLIPVEKINDLVQERLRERPDLAGRQVRLATGLGGSLNIYVGHQAFDSVSDIPDPQVRTLIQDAIREWEGG